MEYLFTVIDTNWRTLCSPRQSCYIILYADDILLIAPSVLELESLFHACERELSWLDMAINYKWVRLVDRNFILKKNLLTTTMQYTLAKENHITVVVGCRKGQRHQCRPPSVFLVLVGHLT